jgi:hypothetical protein
MKFKFPAGESESGRKPVRPADGSHSHGAAQSQSRSPSLSESVRLGLGAAAPAAGRYHDAGECSAQCPSPISVS